MIQLDELILYHHDGRTRTISFRRGRLNVITGDSRTGKSSLINIIRFLLGSGNPHVPRGPIKETVAWYGLRGGVGDSSFLIARQATDVDESAEAMLTIGETTAPAFEDLAPNTSAAALREYLGGLMGLEDNLNVPAPGHTRRALTASFVHSLIYCFQGQGEIASQEILFHRQNREWMPQTIRDTLPFFLGAQGIDELRRREELADRQRDHRRLMQRLRQAEGERTAGLDRAKSLLVEAVDVGLLDAVTELIELAEARVALKRVVDNPTAVAQAVSVGGEFERLRHERARRNSELRDIGEQMIALDEFANVGHDYSHELAEQAARLASVGLIPEEQADALCALCQRPLGEHAAGLRETVATMLTRTERRLDLARRDAPRIERARAELISMRTAVKDVIDELDVALEALARKEEAVRLAADSVNAQSYVRGRIALYLDTSEDSGEAEVAALRTRLATLAATIEALASTLDIDAVRSRTTSALRTVGRQLTAHAEALALEHSEHGALIDLDRLTIVVDTPGDPAFMDDSEIGSGTNWVGYHLAAYLALQQFFIAERRPVPSFVVLDQPSQAFFPRDRQAGGDLDELQDTDRENTRRLYELISQVVEEEEGQLQIIALDHADFPDAWFADSVVERWRQGEALIPRQWLSPQTHLLELTDRIDTDPTFAATVADALHQAIAAASPAPGDSVSIVETTSAAIEDIDVVAVGDLETVRPTRASATDEDDELDIEFVVDTDLTYSFVTSPTGAEWLQAEEQDVGIDLAEETFVQMSTGARPVRVTVGARYSIQRRELSGYEKLLIAEPQ